MSPKLSPRVRIAVGALILVGTVLGWWLFWFLTDDAFIAFRYVSNSVAGRGLVWNPAPFLPVEGYTSFLWVLLLDLCWRVTGIEPPVAANWLSLGFGMLTLAFTYRLLASITLPARVEPHRGALVVLAMVGILSNRTFLAWLSSGLETALFNFTVIWWVAVAMMPEEVRGRRYVWLLSISTACMALTRPDGLLYLVGTAVLLVGHWRRQPTWRGHVGVVSLLAIPAHLIFRRATYGSWLPNTYYAKQTGPWPEAGWRYMASFVVEYGLWLWLGLAVLWYLRRKVEPALREGDRWPSGIQVVVATLGAHVAYYTVMIGGDHFEYRVYSHLVPLLHVAAMWMVAQVVVRPPRAVLCMALLVVVSWPIPWAHWLATKDRVTRLYTFKMFVPIANDFPGPLRPLVGVWDGWQGWLIERLVCARHQEHRVFYEHQSGRLPTRAQGSAIPWDARPVHAMKSVGVGGWVLPNVAILDRFGLNDRVIARQPLDETRARLMAHDRHAPEGYVECFQPNVFVRTGAIEVQPRTLDDETIRECEERSW